MILIITLLREVCLGSVSAHGIPISLNYNILSKNNEKMIVYFSL